MATWKKIISEQDKLSELADVSANGSSAGQLLVYNATGGTYTPALITVDDGELDITAGDATINIGLDATAVKIPAALWVGSDQKIRSNDGTECIILDNNGKTSVDDLDVDGDLTADDVDIDGTVQIDGTVTVGVDGTGKDVKFFGDTSGAYMLWDQSADNLVFAGAAGIDLDGDIDVNGTANLDAVDIDGATQMDGTLAVGVNDTGYNVQFFGDTDGKYMKWDAATDTLDIAGNLTVTGTTTSIDTTNLVVEDKTIQIASPEGSGVGTPSTGSGAGILVETDAAELHMAKISWKHGQGGGNTDGSGTDAGLTGWSVQNSQTSNDIACPIAVMSFKSDAGAPSDISGGIGSFCWNTNETQLYIRTA